eukprot:7710048-Heterocapsa_arctica.AAC.1
MEADKFNGFWTLQSQFASDELKSFFRGAEGRQLYKFDQSWWRPSSIMVCRGWRSSSRMVLSRVVQQSWWSPSSSMVWRYGGCGGRRRCCAGCGGSGIGRSCG